MRWGLILIADADRVGSILTVLDSSPFRNLDHDQEAWLRELAANADTPTLSLNFGSPSTEEPEPIVYFDTKSSCWWSGRFVGEIYYENKSLRILPRFGMPALSRWLSRIWGVRLLPSEGSYSHNRIWLWEVIARLWTARLIAAAKHGLPYLRIEEVHIGPTSRGRLKVKETALRLNSGQIALVSTTRNKKINPEVAGVIVAAFEQLIKQLGHIGVEGRWLPERGSSLIQQLRSGVTKADIRRSIVSTESIRYTPITEIYKPVVDLSRSILFQRPISSMSQGGRKVFGILLDMAEIWELYVHRVLKSGLPSRLVEHTGRATDGVGCLLKSDKTGDTLAALKPDIIIREYNGNGSVCIVDAKYKRTSRSAANPHGVHREDLYQMAAYLSAFGHLEHTMNGFLVYPGDPDGTILTHYAPRNPWSFEAIPNRKLNFVSLSTIYSSSDSLNSSERLLVDFVDSLIGGAHPLAL